MEFCVHSQLILDFGFGKKCSIEIDIFKNLQLIQNIIQLAFSKRPLYNSQSINLNRRGARSAVKFNIVLSIIL